MPSEDVLRDKRHRMFRNNHKLKSFLITFRFSFIMLPLKWLFRSFFFFFFREAVGMRNRRLPILHIFRSEENVSLLLQRYQIISIDSISCFKQKKNYRVFRKYKLFDTNYSLILTIIVPFFIITPQSFLSQTNENNNPRLPIISAISDLLM